MHVKRIAVTAITAALLLGACGSSKKSGGAAAPSTTAAAASAAAKTTAAAGGAAAKTTAAAAPATTAAAGGAAATGSFKMAGLYANTSDAFWLSYKCGAIKRAKKLGAFTRLRVSIDFADGTALRNLPMATVITLDDGGLIVAVDELVNEAFFS